MINFKVTEKEINEYRQAQPFPHMVIDDFLPPSLLNGVIDDFRNYNNWGWDNSDYSKDHQVKKFFSLNSFHEIYLKNNEPVHRKQFKILDTHRPFLEESLAD
jgi:hypothetical protein